MPSEIPRDASERASETPTRFRAVHLSSHDDAGAEKKAWSLRYVTRLETLGVGHRQRQALITATAGRDRLFGVIVVWFWFGLER